MTTSANIAKQAQPTLFDRVRSLDGLRLDWIVVLLTLWFEGGLFLDGWAHNHGFVDDSFFTPWHAVFYTGFGAVAAVLGIVFLANSRAGKSFREAMPNGYFLSLIGVGIFALGGVGDMIWHTLFGIEEDIEALLSPTHLMLGLGMALIFTGPLRAAWKRNDNASGWRAMFPVVLSLTFMLALFGFFTQYAHPLLEFVGLTEDTGGGYNSEIFIMNADGTGQTRVLNAPDSAEYHPNVNPVTDQIAIVSERTGNTEIYVMNTDGSGLTQITNNEASDIEPAWSPDGSQIAFASDRSGESLDVYVMDADGTNVTRLTDDDRLDGRPAWSPDGEQIAFISARDGVIRLYTMNADGSNQTPAASNDPGNEQFGPSWSPDGSQIAYQTNIGHATNIYVVEVESGEVTQITHSDDAYNVIPAWSPDGSQLAFMSDRDGNQEVYVMQADGSSPVNLSQNPGLSDGFAYWTSDGSQLVYRVRSEGSGGFFTFVDQVRGISTVLLQTVILLGVLMIGVTRFKLPVGSLTLITTISVLIAQTQNDIVWFPTLAALLAGITADLILWRGSGSKRIHLMGFAVPFVLFLVYFLGLNVSEGIKWSLDLWLGTVFLAGAAGLLLSFLITASQKPPERLTA